MRFWYKVLYIALLLVPKQVPAAAVTMTSTLICYCSIATVACIWHTDFLPPTLFGVSCRCILKLTFLTCRQSLVRLGTITYLIFINSLNILTSIWWLGLDVSTWMVKNVEDGSVEVMCLLRLRIVYVHLKWSNDAFYDSPPCICEIQLRLPTMVTSTGIVSVAGALPMVLSFKAFLKGFAKQSR